MIEQSIEIFRFSKKQQVKNQQGNEMFIHFSLVHIAGIVHLWDMWWLDCSDQS